MATFTQNLADRFPAGTTVGAYPKSNWGKGDLPPSGAPKGSAAATAAVAGDGTLTLTGLSYSTDYYLTNSTGSLGYVSVNLGPAPAGGGTPAPGSITRAMLTAAARDPWLPAGALAQNMPVAQVASASLGGLSTGRLLLAGGITLPGGVPVSQISFLSGSTALATGTHQWFALYDAGTLALLRQTVDDLANAWAANSVKTLALSSSYTPGADQRVLVGVMVAATTVPTLSGLTVVSSASQVSVPAGTSTTGLAGAAPDPAAAPVAINNVPYCSVG